MPQMTVVQAVNSAMDVMLGRDPNVLVFGEDVGFYGGVFRCTEGLQKKHGDQRVFDTPIAEGGMLAVAVGMGAYGLRPVVEIQFADYIYPATDQLISEAARIRYRSGGEFWAPITVRAPCGGGIFGGQTHSQSVEAIFTHVCGLKTVIPSNPYDAKGLLISAIEDDDPVVFFEPKRLYHGPFDGHPDRPASPWGEHPQSEVPGGYYSVPLGEAAVVREGAAGARPGYRPLGPGGASRDGGAALGAWQAAVGQEIREEDPLVDVMTDKATVELPAPIGGPVVALNGQPGEKRAVGSELVVLDVAGVGNAVADAPEPVTAKASPNSRGSDARASNNISNVPSSAAGTAPKGSSGAAVISLSRTAGEGAKRSGAGVKV